MNSIVININSKPAYELANNQIRKLPGDWLRYSIFNLLSLHDLSASAKVCKYWNSRASDLLGLAYRNLFFPSVEISPHAPQSLINRCKTRHALICQNIAALRFSGSISDLLRDNAGKPLYEEVSQGCSQYGSLYFQVPSKSENQLMIQGFRLSKKSAARKFLIKGATALQHSVRETPDQEILFTFRNQKGGLSWVREKVERQASVLHENPAAHKLSIKNSLSYTVAGDALVYQQDKRVIHLNPRSTQLVAEIPLPSESVGEKTPIRRVVASEICRQKLCILITKLPQNLGTQDRDELQIFNFFTKKIEHSIDLDVSIDNERPKLYTTPNYALIYYPRSFEIYYVDLKTQEHFLLRTRRAVELAPLQIQRLTPPIPLSTQAPEGQPSDQFLHVTNFFDLIAITMLGNTNIYDLDAGLHLATLQHAFDEFYYVAWHDGKFIAAGNCQRRRVQEMEVFDFGAADAQTTPLSCTTRFKRAFYSCIAPNHR